jgi:thiosulfate/3-mercaptopyruvate sulfurtransferase
VPPSPLVTPGWLFENLDDPQLVITDVRWYLSGPRGVDAYQEGHLPGALFADVDRDLADPPGPALRGRHPLPSVDRFAEFLARAGIRRGDTVVAYDDGGGATAARLWWLLDYFGLGSGKVLDGGMQAWIAAGHPLETVIRPRAPAPRLTLEPRAAKVVDKRVVARMSAQGTALLLDARATPRFEGKVEPVDARPGHIPGAKSAPFLENLVAPAGNFRARDELARRYQELGATGDRAVIVYCGSGVTACHDLLALTLAGFEGAQLYEGSWSEWAADSALPAALGSGG